MSITKDLLKNALDNKGYSLTNPRLVTFEILYDKGPLTMQELVDATKGTIDRASVYRSVDVFEKAGIAQRIYSGWKYKIELSDDFQEHHHHFTCLSCSSIIPIHDQELEKMIYSMSQLQKFQVTNHQLEIQGLCDKCL